MAGVGVPVSGGRGAPHGALNPHPKAPKAVKPPKGAVARAAKSRVRSPSLTPEQVLAGRSGNWTQPLSPKQVVQQANALVTQAYQPATSELNLEESQQNGILAKQVADNQYYQNWLDAKSAALQANEAQVNSATNALESQLTSDQAGGFGAQSANLTAAANDRAGNVSNNAASFAPGGSALGAELGSTRQGLENELGAAAKQSLAVENTSSNALGAAIANTGAVVASGQAKEQGAFNTQMMKIAQSRAALGAKEGADLTSEIAKLQGVQISLAENDRNYATATAKLGITAANTSSEIANRAANTKLAAGRLSVERGRLHETITEDQIRNDQTGEKIALQAANTSSEIALRNAQIWKDTHPQAKGISQTAVNTITNSIRKAAGEMNGLIGQQGLTPQQAYAAMLQGGYQAGKKWIHVTAITNQSLLNAAFHVRSGGSGLTPGDLKYLTQLGLTGINSYFPVASTYHISQGGANSPH